MPGERQTIRDAVAAFVDKPSNIATREQFDAAMALVRTHLTAHPDLVAPALTTLIGIDVQALQSSQAAHNFLDTAWTASTTLGAMGYRTVTAALPPSAMNVLSNLANRVDAWLGGGVAPIEQLGATLVAKLLPSAVTSNQASAVELPMGDAGGPNEDTTRQCEQLVANTAPQFRGESIEALCRLPTDDKRAQLQDRLFPLIVGSPRSAPGTADELNELLAIDRHEPMPNGLPLARQLAPLTALVESTALDPEFVVRNVMPGLARLPAEGSGRLLGGLAKHLVRLTRPEDHLSAMRMLVGHVNQQGLLQRLPLDELASALLPLSATTHLLPDAGRIEVETRLAALINKVPERTFSKLIPTPGTPDAQADALFDRLLTATGLQQSVPLRDHEDFDDLLHIGIEVGMARTGGPHGPASTLSDFIANIASNYLGDVGPVDALAAARSLVESTRRTQSTLGGTALNGVMALFARIAMGPPQATASIRSDLGQVLMTHRRRLNDVLTHLSGHPDLVPLAWAVRPDARTNMADTHTEWVDGLQALPFETLRQVDSAFQKIIGARLIDYPRLPEELSDRQADALLDVLTEAFKLSTDDGKVEFVDLLQQALLQRHGIGQPPRLPDDAAQRPEIAAHASRLARLVQFCSVNDRPMPGSFMTSPEVEAVRLDPQWQLVLDALQPAAAPASALPATM